MTIEDLALKGSNAVLPDTIIQQLLDGGYIGSHNPLDPDQVQPASIDLRLGKTIYRVRSSFLAGDKTVIEAMKKVSMCQIDINSSHTFGALLEPGAVYVAPLKEYLDLPDFISATTNPKSSTGRVDVLVRVITDYGVAFDHIPAGYSGPLYLLISPKSFPIHVSEYTRLAQLRLRVGSAVLSDAELNAVNDEQSLVFSRPATISGGLVMSVNLLANNPDDIIGYRAKRHAGAVVMNQLRSHLVNDYWVPIFGRDVANGLILDPNEFYILASKERIRVPPHLAAEMIPYETKMGEFRVHYAGFFDPGFGDWHNGGQPSRGVLEIRAHDVGFLIEDGQMIGRLVYERLHSACAKTYGSDAGSNYQGQGLRLSKHFYEREGEVA